MVVTQAALGVSTPSERAAVCRWFSRLRSYRVSSIGGTPAARRAFMAAAAQQGAPVPAVIAIDSEGRALDRACFLLEYVDGRSVPDTAPGYHADGWLREAAAAEQRTIWESFHDAVAALHSIDVNGLSAASHGPTGTLTSWTIGGMRCSMPRRQRPSPVSCGRSPGSKRTFR